MHLVFLGLPLLQGCESKGSERAVVASAKPIGLSASVESARVPEPSDTPLAFPVVAGWEREVPRPFEHEPGYSLGYNGGSATGPLTVTVYVYTRGRTTIPSGASSELVNKELDEAVAAIEEMVRLKEAFRSVDVRERDAFNLGTSSVFVPTQRVVLQLEYFDGRSTTSTIMLTASRNQLVKIRVTQPGQDPPKEDEALRPLFEALGRAIR